MQPRFRDYKMLRRVGPTAMKSEPGILGSMCWGKGTQVVGIFTCIILPLEGW